MIDIIRRRCVQSLMRYEDHEVDGRRDEQRFGPKKKAKLDTSLLFSLFSRFNQSSIAVQVVALLFKLRSRAQAI